MPRTIDAIEQLVAGGYKRTANSGSWSGGCAAFVYNAGGFSKWVTHATLAAIHDGAEDTGTAAPGARPGTLHPGPPPRGWIGFWGGVWDNANNWWSGHTAFGQGGNRILGGSKTMAELGTAYGWDIGSCDFDAYNRTTQLPYLGCSPYWEGETLAGTSTTGGNTHPLTDPKDQDMPIAIGLDHGLPTQVSFSVSPGVLQRHSLARMQELAAAQAQQPGGCYWYSDEDFLETMIINGLGEFVVADARALTGNGRLVASWLNAKPDYKALAAELAPLLKQPVPVTLPPLTISLTGEAHAS